MDRTNDLQKMLQEQTVILKQIHSACEDHAVPPIIGPLCSKQRLQDQWTQDIFARKKISTSNTKEKSENILPSTSNTKEKSKNILPLLERHYLIIDGEISGQSKATCSEKTKFSRLVNKLVRSIILNFTGEKLSDDKNFLFYLISNSEPSKPKKLKVLVAMSGFGKSGQEGCTDEYNKCNKLLQEAIKISKLHEEKVEVEGIFIPFSRKGDRNVNKEFSYLKIAYKIFEKDGFLKASLIAKILLGIMLVNTHSLNTLLEDKHYRTIFIAVFNEAHQACRRIREAVKESTTDREKYIDIETLSFVLLNELTANGSQETGGNLILNPKNISCDILKEMSNDDLLRICDEMPSNVFSFFKLIFSDHIQENIQFLSKLSRTRINHYFDKNQTTIEDFIKNKDYVIAKYKECLKKVWDHCKVNIYSIIQYQARCSEDNLIDYLSYNSDILNEEGIHYIFSVKKGSVSRKVTKNISIRPPCSYCIIHFPVEIAEIAYHKAGLSIFSYKERLECLYSSMQSLPDKLQYLSEFASEEDLENLFNKIHYIFGLKNKHNKFIYFTFLMNAVKRDMKGVVHILIKKWPFGKKDYDYVLKYITFEAASVGSTNVLQFLITEKNMSMNLMSEETQDTVLHAAVKHNHLKTVEMLLNLANEKRLSTEFILQLNESGISSIHCSACYKRLDIFKKLKEAIQPKKLLTALAAKAKTTVQTNNYIWNALFAAVYSSNIEMVSEIWSLEKNNVTPEEKLINENAIECTLVHVAAVRGDFEICEFLVNENFYLIKNDSFSVPDTGFKNFTAFRLAFTHSNEEVANFLFEKINCDQADEVCEYIKKSIEAKDSLGNNGLHLLAGQGFHQLLSKLIEFCSLNDVISMNNAGATPVDFAMACGHREVSEILVKFVKQ